MMLADNELDNDNLFSILPLLDTVRRTIHIYKLHFGMLWPRTFFGLSPVLFVALCTAWLHGIKASPKAQAQTQLYYYGNSPFDEIMEDLPLVLWHAAVLGMGCMVGSCLLVRMTAEWYAQAPSATGNQRLIYTPIGSAWRMAVQKAKLLFQSAMFMAVSVTAVWLAGHLLSVGLWDMRQNAARAKHKDIVLAFIAMAATVMVLAVVGVAVFGVLWLLGMYTTVVPIVLLEQHDEAIDVFRQAYVLSRDSRSYIFASGTLVALPTALAAFILACPFYVATRKHDSEQDFVEWLLLTTPGVLALYLPAFVGLPIASIHQTVLYVTLRVCKDKYTLQILRGDLERSAPEYSSLLARGDEMDPDGNQEHNNGDVEMRGLDPDYGEYGQPLALSE